MPKPLESALVVAIFEDCLMPSGVPAGDVVQAEGVLSTIPLYRDKLELHRQEITEMLSELPDEFKQSGGGGWSFLNACMDKHGFQWTGFHSVMSELFMLGSGLGLVEFLLPREIWTALPGGVPYVLVKL